MLSIIVVHLCIHATNQLNLLDCNIQRSEVLSISKISATTRMIRYHIICFLKCVLFIKNQKNSMKKKQIKQTKQTDHTIECNNKQNKLIIKMSATNA